MSVWSAESNPVRRGGCWGNAPRRARVAIRHEGAPGVGCYIYGFRLARRCP